MSENDERARYVEAALACCGTPYHHQAMIRGAGLDCATLLIRAGIDSGVITSFDLPEYSPQWHLSRTAEKYLATIGRICEEVPVPPEREPKPGDIALWRFGRTFSHAAIIVEWPRIVHACLHDKVRVDDYSKATWLRVIGEGGPLNGKPRPMKIVSYWGP